MYKKKGKMPEILGKSYPMYYTMLLNKRQKKTRKLGQAIQRLKEKEIWQISNHSKMEMMVIL